MATKDYAVPRMMSSVLLYVLLSRDKDDGSMQCQLPRSLLIGLKRQPPLTEGHIS